MANLMVIVSYKVFPAHMGGQKGIVLFYHYLKEHHSIHMMVSNDNETCDPGYSVEKLLFSNNMMGRNFLRLNQLRTRVKEKRIDCIIAEHSYTGWIALLLRKLLGIPFIIHSHNIEASRFRQMGKKGWKMYHRYERWIHRQADFNFFKTREELQTALQRYKLDRTRCGVIPYGIEPFRRVINAKEKVRNLYGITSTHIFYFNGTLDYTPNTVAVERLVEDINPLLLETRLDFTILISGKRIDPKIAEKINQTATIRYIGFVEEVEMLYQAATIFVNPVINDSGVKTKVVEAIANHCTVVSTLSGATGVPIDLCPPKLKCVKDGDWKEFVDEIIRVSKLSFSETPSTFFDYFSWKNIACRTAEKIEMTISNA